MIANYAWNCSPIDGTDVAFNVPVMGCDSSFPLTLQLILPVLPLVLCLTQMPPSLPTINRPLSTLILLIKLLGLLLLTISKAHCDLANASHSAPTFAFSDLIMV
jgi:hypothetical protein